MKNIGVPADNSDIPKVSRARDSAQVRVAPTSGAESTAQGSVRIDPEELPASS
jgi:hypothetical protein